MTQTEMIADFMKRNKGITTLQAFNELGITRLSARIYELKEKYEIGDIFVDVVNRYGDIVQVKKYFIKGIK